MGWLQKHSSVKRLQLEGKHLGRGTFRNKQKAKEKHWSQTNYQTTFFNTSTFSSLWIDFINICKLVNTSTSSTFQTIQQQSGIDWQLKSIIQLPSEFLISIEIVCYSTIFCVNKRVHLKLHFPNYQRLLEKTLLLITIGWKMIPWLTTIIFTVYEPTSKLGSTSTEKHKKLKRSHLLPSTSIHLCRVDQFFSCFLIFNNYKGYPVQIPIHFIDIQNNPLDSLTGLC